MRAPPTTTPHGARYGAAALNALHSIPYFTDDLARELEGRGLADASEVYLAGRASPLGAVTAGAVVGAFTTFSLALVMPRMPAVWDRVTPTQAIAARERAAESALTRLLGSSLARSSTVERGAELATAAAGACGRAGRPLASANADLAPPATPVVALWQAATHLREHRGDGHGAVLNRHDLAGVDALVLDCASTRGMDRGIVAPMRGWTTREWQQGVERLRARGLIEADQRLTDEGVALREEIEDETDRLDRAPYAALGPDHTAELGELTAGLVHVAADAGAFPPPLRGFFVPA